MNDRQSCVSDHEAQRSGEIPHGNRLNIMPFTQQDARPQQIVFILTKTMETIIDDNNFKNEINRNNTPVLVDFYATWCAPCAMLSPILDKIAKS